jgi:phosphoribosyl 1,2-cyclic phosphate phosphodiesterase
LRLTLLGTGAADGIPSFYGDTEVNRYARLHGGKDIRSRSAALVDEELKIDLGPDTLGQCQRFGIDPMDWTAVLFTHSHADHLCRSELQYFLHPFNERDQLKFTIYGNRKVLDLIYAAYADWPMELIETRSFETFAHAGYEITPIHANHALDEDSQNLIVRRNGCSLLYATDTGYWEEKTWEFLQDQKIGTLVIECTDGFETSDYWGHLNIAQCAEVVERLRRQGTLKPNAQVLTTHHSTRGGATHSQLEVALCEYGIEPGYDGMVVDVR